MKTTDFPVALKVCNLYTNPSRIVFNINFRFLTSMLLVNAVVIKRNDEYCNMELHLWIDWAFSPLYSVLRVCWTLNISNHESYSQSLFLSALTGVQDHLT
jgi:hypothetical protein